MRDRMKRPDTLKPNGIQSIKILMLGILCHLSRLLCLVMHGILLRRIKSNTFHINILRSVLYDRTQDRI